MLIIIQQYGIIVKKHVQRKFKLYKKGHYDLSLIIRQVHIAHC